ncbi:MAG TPA: sigma-70 family RNA polymerase sigma factor [Acidimicrobiales bacterium]|nr:sigma-70 family RNA polymerase sigma factor [Acidimicrobiales bacterium]
MADQNWLAERFEEQRPRLRAVAYRMLGSFAEAEDAVQDAWLRVSRADTSEVDNLGAWLTTVVARLALNMLRSRTARRQEPLDHVHIPDPVVDPPEGTDPEHEALLANSVGMALLVVLESLSPAERLAFVLHDMFGVPFDEIAPIVERSPEAARQLASRARRRVQGSPVPDPDLDAQWRVVDAFLAAARAGDFEALVAVLDPDVVLRADGGVSGLSHFVRGAAAVARQATFWGRAGLGMRRALVNGAAGLVSERDGKAFAVGALTINNGRIIECDFLVDPDRVAQLDLEVLRG